MSAEVTEPPDGGVTGLGEKDAVTPVGFPESDNVTAELNPFSALMVAVELPEPPCWIVRVLGEMEREKSGEGGLATTNVTEAVCDFQLRL